MDKDINPSIACSVQQCEFHDGEQDYCTLDVIEVGTHEDNPTEVKCVDCESFRVK